MKRSGMVGAVTVFAALIAWSGCGGVSGTDDLFSAAAGNGGASTSSSHGATGPSSSSGTSAATASSSSGAATTSSSVASSSSGASSSVTSSSSGGPPVQVTCNGGSCQPGQVCCFNPNGPGDHCAPPGTCMPGYVQFSCNGPEDCPGGSCCATVDTNKQVPYLGMACQPACNPSNQVVVCSDQQPDVCPPNTQCKASQSLGAGYHICWPG